MPLLKAYANSQVNTFVLFYFCFDLYFFVLSVRSLISVQPLLLEFKKIIGVLPKLSTDLPAIKKRLFTVLYY